MDAEKRQEIIKKFRLLHQDKDGTWLPCSDSAIKNIIDLAEAELLGKVPSKTPTPSTPATDEEKNKEIERLKYELLSYRRPIGFSALNIREDERKKTASEIFKDDAWFESDGRGGKMIDDKLMWVREALKKKYGVG